MKKILIPVLFASCVVLTTTSCKKDGATDAQQSEVKISSDADANDIVEFSNNFQQISQSRFNNLNKIESYISQVPTKISSPSTLVLPPVLVPVRKFDTTLGNAFGKEKENLQKQINELEVAYNAIAEKAATLIAYMKAEDFKDDQGAKAKTLTDELSKEIAAYDKLQEEYENKMMPIVNDAENVILKDHPMKEYIIGSKKALREAEVLIDEIHAQADSKTYNEQQLQPLYDKLEKAYQENSKREFKVSDSNYKSKETLYASFNKGTEEFLGIVRKEMRASSESKTLKSNQLQNIDQTYDSMIDKYNNLVN